jgi:hypothetical protein
MPLNRVWIPSPNYSSRGGSDVTTIVLHTAEGSTSIESLGSWFANPSSQVSSHVGIDDKANTVGEYVKRPNKAWTAASANPWAIQAELCAFAAWDSAEWQRHPNMLANTAAWVAEEAAYFGIPLTLLAPGQAQDPGVRGVCQHADLGSIGGGHWDCGPNFPIQQVLDMAGGQPAPEPEPEPAGPTYPWLTLNYGDPDMITCLTVEDGKIWSLHPGGETHWLNSEEWGSLQAVGYEAPPVNTRQKDVIASLLALSK